MYAYITYSSINNELTVFRDPQGEKILYYHENNNEIIFSSEINTIIYYLNGNVKIDYDILSSYFLTRHFSIIDKTVFKNINILKPGHEIKISLTVLELKKEILNLRDLIDKNIYSSLNRSKEKDLVNELDYLLKKISKKCYQKRDYLVQFLVQV